MILLFFTFIFFLVYYVWKRRNLLRLASKIKGPIGYPVIGSAYRFLNAAKILDVINDFHEKFGGPGKFWLGNRLFVYIDDPKHFEVILNSTDSLNKGDSYDFISESIGLGLITLKSDEWRFHRKSLNPSFNYNVVKSFYPIFNEKIRIMVNTLKRHVDAEPFNIQEKLQACAMDMICETTLGLNINAQTENSSAFLHNADNILMITAMRFFQPWIQPAYLFRLSRYSKIYRKCVDSLNALLGELYTSKKTEFFKSSKSIEDVANNNVEDATAEKTIFIDRIMKLALQDKIFTEANVLDELKTILLAGYETTATAATNTCALLACYPELQEKLFEEIKSVVVDVNSDVNQEDLKNMPYLDAFIKESLRYFPVVPFLTRILNEDMALGDTVVPKGTEYILDIWNMHRIQNNWKFDATKFNPENFFPENYVPRHPYSYVPFSAGPRNCIGIKYGNIALKLLIIYVIRNYRLSTHVKLEDIKFRMNVTLYLTNQNMFRLHPRNA